MVNVPFAVWHDVTIGYRQRIIANDSLLTLHNLGATMLDTIIFYAILLTVVLVTLSLVYRFAPFHKFNPEDNPAFVLFPKYKATFSVPHKAIQASLQSLQFKPDDNDQLKFRRGKVYGDFSAKAIRLNVEIDSERNLITVFAPYLVILFDTGDLWRVTHDILQGANEFAKRAH